MKKIFIISFSIAFILLFFVSDADAQLYNNRLSNIRPSINLLDGNFETYPDKYGVFAIIEGCLLELEEYVDKNGIFKAIEKYNNFFYDPYCGAVSTSWDSFIDIVKNEDPDYGGAGVKFVTLEQGKVDKDAFYEKCLMYFWDYTKDKNGVRNAQINHYYTMEIFLIYDLKLNSITVYDRVITYLIIKDLRKLKNADGFEVYFFGNLYKKYDKKKLNLFLNFLTDIKADRRLDRFASIVDYHKQISMSKFINGPIIIKINYNNEVYKFELAITRNIANNMFILPNDLFCNYLLKNDVINEIVFDFIIKNNNFYKDGMLEQFPNDFFKRLSNEKQKKVCLLKMKFLLNKIYFYKPSGNKTNDYRANFNYYKKRFGTNQNDDINKYRNQTRSLQCPVSREKYEYTIKTTEIELRCPVHGKFSIDFTKDYDEFYKK